MTTTYRGDVAGGVVEEIVESRSVSRKRTMREPIRRELFREGVGGGGTQLLAAKEALLKSSWITGRRSIMGVRTLWSA